MQKLIGLFGILFLFQSCSPKLRVNASNDATYLESLKEIRETLDEEAIKDLEMDIVLILFGEHFLQPNSSLQLMSIVELRDMKEEELLKKIDNFTYEEIKGKAKEIENNYYKVQKDKIGAYNNRAEVFKKITFEKIEYFKKPAKSQEELLYPYVEFEVTNKTDFNISYLSLKANVTNDNQPFYEVKFDYNFKDLLKESSTQKLKIQLNNYAHMNGYEDLSAVNTYLDGKVDLIIEEVVAQNDVIKASSTKPDEAMDIKDFLSLIWFNLIMTRSYLFGLEKK